VSSSADGSANKERRQVPRPANELSRGWDGSKDRLQSKGRRLSARTFPQCPRSWRRRGRCGGFMRPSSTFRAQPNSDARRITRSFPQHAGRGKGKRAKPAVETAATRGLPRRPNGRRYCKQSAAMPRWAGRPATRLYGRWL
jgi:hypothetical protein